MSARTVTIRNLTTTSLELKFLDRFEASGLSESAVGIANFTRNLTVLTSWNRTSPSSGSSTSPTATQLAVNARSFIHEEVSIRCDACATTKTDIRPAQLLSNETLRLTFEVNGERYRLDTPCRTHKSTTLTPLTANPHFEYTAVYLSEYAYLTLFSSAHLNAWMQEMRAETPLYALSIPGTHNSPTYYTALPSVRCQAVSPKEQLENGVRFFDVRVQPESPQDATKEGLFLVHSAFPISLTGGKYFRKLVDDVYEFLDQHPSETLIMSLKREGIGNATDTQLSLILKNHYTGNASRWHTAPHIPTLSQARGKIVLLRRFVLDESLKREHSGAGWGIDAETWKDNTPYDTCPSGDICVQDFYEVLETENIGTKITYAEAQLDRSAACVCPLTNLGVPKLDSTEPKQPVYLNFLSASNFWKAGCWPGRIAAKLNPAIVDYLCRKHNEPGAGKQVGDGCTGIVVCDWVGNNGDWDIVRCIVGMNAKLRLREKGL
ncbi:hypothetical protein MMC19_001716 [Ptychographa xylographoides]|nr:hypothetical protein [Ptychographa xylographoides]